MIVQRPRSSLPRRSAAGLALTLIAAACSQTSAPRAGSDAGGAPSPASGASNAGSSSGGDPGQAAGTSNGGSYSAAGDASASAGRGDAGNAGAGLNAAGAGEAGGGGRNAEGGAGASAVAGAGAGGAVAGGGSSGAAPFNNGLGALPVPPGSSNQPRPAGATANLKVLPWAGFKAALTYSFDDSQASQVHHWPDLRATQIAATYYVTSGNHTLEGYDAVWREAVSLGNELGNHTAHHCKYDLSDCLAGTGTAIPEEIDACTTYAKTTLGAPAMWTMAYPYGAKGYAADARSRFFMGRGTGDGSLGFSDATDAFALPVKAAVGGETASVLNGYIDGARADGRWMIFLFHTLRPDAQTEHAYADVQISSVTGSIGHAKALPDLWIGTVANIGAYWLGARAFRGATPSVSGTTTTWRWTLPAHFPTGRSLRVSVDGGSLSQAGQALAWDGHGYYEVALDAGSLSWSP